MNILYKVCAKYPFFTAIFEGEFHFKSLLKLLIYVAYVSLSLMRKLVIMTFMGILHLKRLYGYTEIRHLEEGD